VFEKGTERREIQQHYRRQRTINSW